MGPFPHDAPRASYFRKTIPLEPTASSSSSLPIPSPEALRNAFAKMGFGHVANHKTRCHRALAARRCQLSDQYGARQPCGGIH